jgi:hypothetical protein
VTPRLCESCGTKFYTTVASRFCGPACRNEFYRPNPPPGAEIDDHGNLQGRDPRRMSQAELQAMGFEPMSQGEAIRAHCVDCAGGSADEVQKCMALKCPSWPFRMGKSPWRAGKTPAQLEAARKALQARSLRPSGAGAGEAATSGRRIEEFA